MNEMQEDAIVEKYESLILFVVGLPAFALAFFTYKYFDAMIDEFFMLATAGTAAAIALVVFIVVGIASYRRYRRFPWVKNAPSQTPA